MTDTRKTNSVLLPNHRGTYRRILVLLANAFMAFGLLIAPSSAEAAKPSGAKWEQILDGQTYSAPQAAHGLVYVGTNHGILYAFDGRSGKPKWQFRTDHSSPCFPLVSKDGMVYLSSNKGALYVLSALTGKLSWETTAGVGAEPLPQDRLQNQVFRPALSKSKVVLRTPNGTIYAFDRSTGLELWSFDTGCDYASSPAVYLNKVFVGCGDGRLIAINLASGQEQWTYPALGAIRFQPAISDKRVYFGSTDKRLYVLDAKTGQLLWSRSVRGGIEFTPVLHHNLAYIASSNGQLRAIDIRRRRLAAILDTGGSMVTQPVLDQGLLYMGSNDGKLYAFNSSRSKLMWAYDSKAYMVNPIAASGELIFVVTNRRKNHNLKIRICAFQKSTYPGTEVVIFGYENGLLPGSLHDYFSSTYKEQKTPENQILNLRNTMPWPFGYQFNQVKQALIDLTQTAEKNYDYNSLAKSFNYFSPGLSVITFLTAFQLTPFSFLLLLTFLLLGWTLFLPTFSVLGGTNIVLMLIGSLNQNEKKFSFVRACLKNTIATLRDYQLILMGLLITGLGALISLALFNHLSRVPRAPIFYSAIVFTWTILLVTGSFLRSFSLTFLQKDRLGLNGFSDIFEHALDASFKLLRISVLYLVSGTIITFFLKLGEYYSWYSLTALATFSLIIAITILAFADSIIVNDKERAHKALGRSAYLAIANLELASAYMLFTVVFLGLCGFLISQLLKFPSGSVLCIIVAVFASSYLAHIHASIFQELIQRDQVRANFRS